VSSDPRSDRSPAILMEGPLGQLRELERVLAAAGIAAEVVRPPASRPNT
jgi:hypothetical protein